MWMSCCHCCWSQNPLSVYTVLSVSSPLALNSCENVAQRLTIWNVLSLRIRRGTCLAGLCLWGLKAQNVCVQQITPSIITTIRLSTACSKMTWFLYSGKQGGDGVWRNYPKTNALSELLVLDPGATATTMITVSRLNVATVTTLQKEFSI